MLRRPILCLALSLAAGVALPACSSDDDDVEVPSSIADVVFLDETTDEALLSLLDRPAEDDAAHRVVFDTPTEGATLPSDAPAAFAFHAASVVQRSRRPAPGAPYLTRAVRAMGAFLNPIGVAHAHGTPYNGAAYFWVFSTAEEENLLRVFTASTTYEPDADAWAALVAAGGPITLEVTSAEFENNLLVDGAGPFESGSVSFTIE